MGCGFWGWRTRRSSRAELGTNEGRLSAARSYANGGGVDVGAALQTVLARSETSQLRRMCARCGTRAAPTSTPPRLTDGRSTQARVRDPPRIALHLVQPSAPPEGFASRARAAGATG